MGDKEIVGMELMDETRGYVHLAGASIIIGLRRIQRCVICGYVLDDIDAYHLKDVIPDAKQKRYMERIPRYTPGQLVRVLPTNPPTMNAVGTLESAYQKEPWKDCCLPLVEREFNDH